MLSRRRKGTSQKSDVPVPSALMVLTGADADADADEKSEDMAVFACRLRCRKRNTILK